MATASFRLVVEKERTEGVRKALEDALRSARGCPGCVEARIERDSDDLGALRFHSRWDGRSELRAFLASEHMTRLLQLLELGVEEPEVLICWGDASVGLSSLREIRGATDAGAPSPRTGCGCESRTGSPHSFSFRE